MADVNSMGMTVNAVGQPWTVPPGVDAWSATRRPERLLDSRRHGPVTPAGPGLATTLMKALAECLLDAELKHYLRRPTRGVDTQEGNYRNGSTPKTIVTAAGKIELAVPRMRYTTFTPALIPRYQRRIPGFDADIIALYARGVSEQELQSRLRELYAPDAWADMCRTLTSELLLHVGTWQTRRLAPACELLHIGVARYRRPASPHGKLPTLLLYALGVQAGGASEVLGIWRGGATVRAGLWHELLLDLKARGLEAPAAIAGVASPGLAEAVMQAYPAVAFSSD